ncbi:MAG: bifunctional phosphopantothenoylcysteine decarboxylase/phosphopantothenate--cysteine ligase CoaBC [Deinococcales bacterium]
MAASGGVAALKTPTLIRRLRQAGCEVRAAATEDAYAFVTPLSLAVAANGEVFDRQRWFAADGRIRHLEWAAWADGLVVAPATADALANAAAGRAHDVVSALIAAAVPRVLWAPAMNPAMWNHPPLQRNVEVLEGLGHAFVGPVEGPLAGAEEGEGVGRMAEPDQIVSAALGLPFDGDLRGVRVLVSGGPTREYLDPVRYLSNPSSGRTGFAVAEAARARGAEVSLVTGPSSLPEPAGVQVERVEDAEAMLAALEARFDACDLLVMTAAVGDWRPAERSDRKEPKAEGERSLRLVRTPDILGTLARRRRDQIMVGFAMETHEGVERAARKARDKGLAFIALNYPARPGLGFGADANEITLVLPDGSSESLPRMTKRDLADALLDRAKPLLADAVR